MNRNIRTITAAALLVCAAAAGLVLGGPAVGGYHARVLSVDPGESIQSAIDRAEPGDTVDVAAGVYRENLTITKDGITLQGAGATSSGTVLEPPSTPANRACDFEGMNGICVTGEFTPNTEQIGEPVRNVKVSGFSVRGFPRFGILLNNAVDVEVSGNEASRNRGYGTIGFYLSNVRVLANSFHDNGQGGLYIADSPRANAVVKGNHSFRNATVEGIGLFIRDAAHGVVRDNVLEDNCVGLLIVGSEGRSTSNWAVTHNTVRDNTATCPASEDLPTPLSGLGIGVIGGQQVHVADNSVTRNQPNGDTAVAGGIALVSAKSFGGPDPVGNVVRSNRATDNQPADVVYDGSGRRNRFAGNDCETSLPDRLCR